MISKNARALGIVLTLAALAAGCSTPQPIRDVARKGAETVDSPKSR